MLGHALLLAAESLKRWMRTSGFLVVVAVALVPPALTAAWVWTHQADVAVTRLDWDLVAPAEGDTVNFTTSIKNIHEGSVDSFDVVLRVGYYEADARGNVRWRDVANETTRVGPLEPGEETKATLAWNATGGTFQVEAHADLLEDEIKEIENLNNYRSAQVQVRYPAIRPNVTAPQRAANENGTTPASVNLTLTTLGWLPTSVFEKDNATFSVTVKNEGPERAENATLEFQIARVTPFGDLGAPVVREERRVDLDPGASQDLTFDWKNVQRGAFAVVIVARTPADAAEGNYADNVWVQQLEIQRRLIWEEPEERATAKDFYRTQVLLPIHFTLLVPLVGLFYAGSVVHDDRVRGNLPYVLTRPVPRWLLPVVRFAVGAIVAIVPVLVGVILTYALLLGTPRADAGYLYGPLFFAVLSVFAYTGAFTLLGVMSRRPYLAGLAYVLGFETLIYAGRRILINDRPLIQDWVLNFSMASWIEKAFAGWDPKIGGWLPTGDDPLRAAIVLVVIGAVGVAAAAWFATKREIVQ